MKPRRSSLVALPFQVIGSIWTVAAGAANPTAGGHPWRVKPRLLAVPLLVVVIFVSTAVLIRQLRKSPVSTLDQTYTGVAEAAADEAAKLLAGRGKLVVIAGSECPLYPAAKMYDDFVRAVRSRPNLRIVATQTVKGSADEAPTWSGGDYLHLLSAHRDADLIVSLIGAPTLGDADLARLPAHRSRLAIVVVTGDPRAITPLLENRMVDVAIVPRLHEVPVDSKNLPATPREWFDHEYLVATPASVAQLPE